MQDVEAAERSLRRTRGRVRRYCVRNGLVRLVTLTYRRGVHDFDRMRDDVALFERRLREAYPGLAFLFAFELHPKGHGWHVHGGVSGYVPQGELARLWGHGFVDVRRLRVAGVRGRRADARQVAVYLSKYVGKDARGIPGGRQRYSVRQGFQPARRLVRLGHPEDLRRAALEVCGGEVPTYDWSSDGSPEWTGPPVRYWAFG